MGARPIHPHAAGRAARPPTAQRQVGNAVAAAGLQHRKAARHLHGPVGVAQGDGPTPTAATEGAPCPAQCQQGAHGNHPAPAQGILQPGRCRHGLRSATRGRRGQRTHLPCNLARHGQQAQRRQHRQQHGPGEQRRLPAPPPRPSAHRHVQAQAAMPPCRDEQQRLQHQVLGPGQAVHHAAIRGRCAHGFKRPARGHKVPGQQQRQAQTQGQPHALHPRHAQTAPLPQGHTCQRQVREQRAIQQHRARHRMPPAADHLQQRIGHLQRHQPRGMVAQVQGHVAPQHQTAAPAHLAKGRQARADQGKGHGRNAMEKIKTNAAETEHEEHAPKAERPCKSQIKKAMKNAMAAPALSRRLPAL